MAKDRPPSFQFYPMDYLTDPSVVCMSPAGRGAYVHLLCHGWLQPEPGVIAGAMVQALSGATAELWEDVRFEVELAFDLESRPGFWVQKRMADGTPHSLRIHSASRSASAKGGRAAWKSVRAEDRTAMARSLAKRRWDAERDAEWMRSECGVRCGVDAESTSKYTPTASSLPTPTTATATATAAAAAGESTGTEKQKHSVKNDPLRMALRIEWESGFEVFWERYPRKVGKAAALKSWKALTPSGIEACQPLFDWVLAGLRHWQGSEWSRGEPQFIPHPSTWLNQRRWRDIPQPEEP